jgi:hypothetical protein
MVSGLHGVAFTPRKPQKAGWNRQKPLQGNGSGRIGAIGGGSRPAFCGGLTLRQMPSASESHRLRSGLEHTVRALRQTGRLEPCDALVLALARTAADKAESSSLSDREQRQWARLLSHLELRLRGLGGPVDDSWAQLLAAASGPLPAGEAR